MITISKTAIIYQKTVQKKFTKILKDSIKHKLDIEL